MRIIKFEKLISTKMQIIISIIIIISVCNFFITGCTVRDDVVLTVNDVEISMDQARFYAYNKQANYEVYYLVSGTNIDWNAAYDESDAQISDVTIEDLVKQEVLVQIKKLALVSEYAKDEGISLTDEDKNDINALVEEFRNDSNDTLLAKTGKNKTTLTTIFTRQKYVDKLYEKLEITDDANAQDELFQELLADANTTLNDDLWNSITFDEAIYTTEDVKPME